MYILEWKYLLVPPTIIMFLTAIWQPIMFQITETARIRIYLLNSIGTTIIPARTAGSAMEDTLAVGTRENWRRNAPIFIIIIIIILIIIIIYSNYPVLHLFYIFLLDISRDFFFDRQAFCASFDIRASSTPGSVTTFQVIHIPLSILFSSPY